jgi:hypothetical protein
MIVIFFCAGAASAQKSGALKPCRLLTAAEAGKILGVKVELKADDREANESLCYYAAADGEKGVSVILRGYPNRKQARDFFMSNRKLQANLCNGFKLVSNVGESAWMCEISGYSKYIGVLQNNVMFEFSVTAEKFPAAALKRRARQIAARLRAN